jgi:Cof subfamily protein (haloacid dehalogenase superfamily)
VPVKLLAVDLDFTLLDAEREIAEVNLRAVRRAVENGIAVALASGRGAAGMRRYAKHLGLNGPMVTCNGAFVVMPTGEIVKEHVMPAERLAKVIDFARSGNHHLHLYCREEVLMPAYTPWVDVYVNKAKQHPPRAVGWDGIAAATPNKAIIITAPETVLEIEASARALFDESEAVTLSEPEYLEFLCPEANKATGLAAVADFLGIAQAETAAIGDYYNDVPMLLWAGHSAAVENAPDGVRAVATVVVPRHDQGGVATYIEYLFSELSESAGGSIVYNEGRAG